MGDLRLSIAVGDYDRMRPLMDGFVQIDGVDPVFMRLTPEEIFFRAMRHAEFDVCELSLSSFSVRTARGDNPYVGVPVFPSRAFRHTSIYIRTDRGIARPEDMRGRRIGVPEYQLTANVWARAILDDDHGVSGVRHHLGARRIEPGRAGREGRAEPAARHPHRGRAGRHHPVGDAGARRDRRRDRASRAGRVRRSDPDYRLAVRRSDRRGGATISAAPASFRSCTCWACAAASPSSIRGCRARCTRRSRRRRILALEKLADVSASKVTLPFVEVHVMRMRALMGQDYWSYGVEAEPAWAGDVSAPPPPPGPVGAPAGGGGTVPSGDAGDVQGVIEAADHRRGTAGLGRTARPEDRRAGPAIHDLASLESQDRRRSRGQATAHGRQAAITPGGERP